MSRKRVPLMGALSAVLAVLALLAAPALPGASGGQVLAHAHLVASSPGAGSSIQSPPDELRLVFSEPLEERLTSLDLSDESGTLLLDRVGKVDSEDPFALVVDGADLGQLADGVYTVRWRTLSTGDGHPAEGTFSFGIGAEPAPGTSAIGIIHADTSLVEVIGRWLTYLGLMLALGVGVSHRVVLGFRGFSPALGRILAAGLVVSGIATLVAGFASGMDADGNVSAYLTESRTGILQLARAVVALSGAGLLLASPGRLAPGVATSTGLLGICLMVAAGHAAVLPGLAGLLAGVAHVVGAAVWIGGLTVLLLSLWRPALLFGLEPPRR